MSASGATTIGVGEIITIVVLVMVLLIIMKYCCKRMEVAMRTELEKSIRNASAPTACTSASSSGRDSYGDVWDSGPEDNKILKAALWIKSAGLVWAQQCSIVLRKLKINVKRGFGNDGEKMKWRMNVPILFDNNYFMCIYISNFWTSDCNFRLVSSFSKLLYL